jgi:hypothetical protein
MSSDADRMNARVAAQLVEAACRAREGDYETAKAPQEPKRPEQSALPAIPHPRAVNSKVKAFIRSVGRCLMNEGGNLP